MDIDEQYVVTIDEMELMHWSQSTICNAKQTKNELNIFVRVETDESRSIR